MITTHLPNLSLPLLGYIIAANLLTIFIGYVERKLLKPYICDFLYLFLAISTLLIFFSVIFQSEYFEIFGITIVVVSYFLMAFVLASMPYLWLKTAVKGLFILRQYRGELMKKEKLKKNK